MQTKDLVLQDVELCKQVAPIMERLGIEPDDRWFNRKYASLTGHDPNEYMLWSEEHPSVRYGNWGRTVPTYRQDKLALALPKDWTDIHFVTEDIWEQVVYYRGQNQLEATAKLILLLEENNLLEVNDAK